MGKRIFDISISFLTLAALFLPMLLIACLVRIKIGSPVLFCQKRPGKDEQPFLMMKFRTMTDETDAHGTLLPDEERLTPFGQFLRSTSLDELPELINVLKGGMSLVGPRPLLMHYLPLYSDVQRRRHEVRPGITGWAQVNGRNDTTWEERFGNDVWYVDHQSLWLDIKILALTVRKIIRREGISQDGHATMPEFDGKQP